MASRQEKEAKIEKATNRFKIENQWKFLPFSLVPFDSARRVGHARPDSPLWRRCECRRCHSLVLVRSSCYCHEKRRSCEKAGWEAEESGKQTHMSFPVFSWMGSLLIESERIRAHTYKWCTHTHTPTQKHAWFRGRGAQRQEEKSRSCTMTFLTFCVVLLKGSLLRLVELDSVTEP